MFRTNYVADECEHKVCAADNNQHYRGPTAIARKQIAQIFDLREEFHLIKRRDDKAQERYDRAKGKSYSLSRGNRDYRQNEVDDYRNVGDGDKIRRENNVELCKFVRFEHHVEHIGKVFKADVFFRSRNGIFRRERQPEQDYRQRGDDKHKNARHTCRRAFFRLSCGNGLLFRRGLRDGFFFLTRGQVRNDRNGIYRGLKLDFFAGPYDRIRFVDRQRSVKYDFFVFNVFCFFTFRKSSCCFYLFS